MAMKIGFIGAGKVGFSLGRYFKEQGLDITGFVSRSYASAQDAAAFTASHAYESISEILSRSDTLFITVPDSAISNVWADMKDLDVKNKNICHCSGSIASTAFFDGENRGACVYSVHPLYAINDKYHSWQQLQQAYFTVEGSARHLAEIKSLLESAGNVVISMDTQYKPLYHAAAVMASNLSTALFQTSVDMLVSCGFGEGQACEALVPLFAGNAAHIAQDGVAASLTGPVQRNDVQTVQKHLKVLSHMGRTDWEMLYRILSLRLTAVAAQQRCGNGGKSCDYTKMKGILTHHE